MDFSSIKHILRENTRYIIIENGEPSHIIIPIKEYEGLIGGQPGRVSIEEDFEKINRDVALLGDKDLPETETKIADEGFKEIRIEDLPF